MCARTVVAMTPLPTAVNSHTIPSVRDSDADDSSDEITRIAMQLPVAYIEHKSPKTNTNASAQEVLRCIHHPLRIIFA